MPLDNNQTQHAKGDWFRTFAGKPHNYLVNSGRTALAICLDDLKAKHGASRVWIPTFICESVARACRRSGFSVHQYAIDLSLATIPESLAGIRDGDVFLWVHYFGILNISNQEAIAGKYIFVIEDAVQSLFTGGIGQFGEYTFNSFRKFTASPDGAALGAAREIYVSLKEPDSLYVQARVEAKRLRADGACASDFLTILEDSEHRLDNDECYREMSETGIMTVSRVDVGRLRAQRRANFLQLLEVLGRVRGVDSLIKELPSDAVPLGFPIIVEASLRNALRKMLAHLDVYCPIHWVLPEGIKYHGLDKAFVLSNTVLTIPIDQRYDAVSMSICAERIVAAMDALR